MLDFPVPVPATYSEKERETTWAPSPISAEAEPGGQPVPAQVTSMRGVSIDLAKGEKEGSVKEELGTGR